MPEPGSKKYDIRRSHRRKDAENRGVPDQQANEELRRDPRWRSRGPRTERGEGPRGERGRQPGQAGRRAPGGQGEQQPETD